MTKPIFLEKYKNYFKMSSAEIFTQSTKCLGVPLFRVSIYVMLQQF